MTAAGVGLPPPVAQQPNHVGLSPKRAFELSILAQTIAQLAVRILFLLGNFFILASVLPISFHAVILPLAAIGLAFLSAFFFQPESFYCPSIPQPIEPLLEPIPEPGPLLREHAPPVLFPPDSPRGIIRGGNNCWLNSDLQLFASDPFILQWMRDPLPLEPPPDPGFAQVHAAFREFFQAWDRTVADNRPVAGNSSALRRAIANFNPMISPFDQEDAHEGVNQILDQLPLDQKIHFEVRHHYNTAGLPPIVDHPDGINTLEERPWGLELAIQKRETNLQGMIDMYCNEEGTGHGIEFAGADEVVRRYPHIRSERRFLEAPPLLRITLKRFFYQKAAESWLTKVPYLAHWFPRLMGYVIKNIISIRIPLELCIALADGTAQQYRLKSFNCHLGETTNSGHYTAYSRRGNQWYFADDTFVIPVDQPRVEEALASAQPYMVWYERE